jgi:translation initiation factor 2B subunit (eIF-2B alpha/beta/delta family)
MIILNSPRIFIVGLVVSILCSSVFAKQAQSSTAGVSEALAEKWRTDGESYFEIQKNAKSLKDSLAVSQKFIDRIVKEIDDAVTDYYDITYHFDYVAMGNDATAEDNASIGKAIQKFKNKMKGFRARIEKLVRNIKPAT